jgi:hypothetical protein
MTTRIDSSQISRFAAFLPSLGNVKAFDFCTGGEGMQFPRRNQPGALEAFFFNAAHQFGFWNLDGERYGAPMIAPAGGKMRKGSDFLFYCVQRSLNRSAAFFDPHHLSELSDVACDVLFHDDNGVNPLPMWPEHRDIIRNYAEWFVRNKTSPGEIVRQANQSNKPLASLLAALKHVPGYAEDPMQKKAMLLAVILENRPEHFLVVNDPESAVPIIDYHLQRSALRTGLVMIDDPILRRKIENRELVLNADEKAIRAATYKAIRQLVDKSGLSVAAVDYFFFTNRTRCPEMTEPLCAECPVNTICRHETKLFQPVIRTTYY